jgi:hypothetical protein
MSYQRVAKPRAYIDIIQPSLVNGQISATSEITGSGLVSDANTIIQLFDNKPTNTVNLGGKTTTTTQYITVDFGIDENATLLGETMFVAILGHNLKSADAKFKIETDDASDFGSAQTPTMTEILNADVAGGFATPEENGWSLITYSQTSDNRYQRIVIDDVSTYDVNIEIGCILWGMVYNFPVSADLNVKQSFDYDGLKINESLGGQKYGHATHLTNGSWTSYTEPWNNTTTAGLTSWKSGRKKINMSFSFMSESETFHEKLYGVNETTDDDALLNRIVMMTNGGMHPLLLQMDTNNGDASDGFLWCRLDKSPTFDQVAHRQYSTNLSFVEEF